MVLLNFLTRVICSLILFYRVTARRTTYNKSGDALFGPWYGRKRARINLNLTL